MTLKEKWNSGAKLRLLGAVLLNALVLACILAFRAMTIRPSPPLSTGRCLSRTRIFLI